MSFFKNVYAPGKESPVEKAAKNLNIKTLTPSSLKNEDIFLKFKELKPDLVVVVAYGLILPEKYLIIPPFGCINGHASLLPRWRGAAPIQRSIEAGDKKNWFLYYGYGKGYGYRSSYFI